MRDHEAITIEEFNGLWKRGDADSCPPDHFSDCNNIQYIQSGFRWRDGIATYPGKENVLRIYTFIQETGESLLILTDDGKIWDSSDLTNPILGPITGMTDFAYTPISGRAYISPSDGRTGLDTEHVYVYEGDPTVPARVVGATPPDNGGGNFTAANSGTAGDIEAGIHIFGVVFETSTGFLSRIGPSNTTGFAQVTAPGSQKVNLTNVCISSDPVGVVLKRRIVATKAIDPTLFTGNKSGYQFFFVPNGTINDNVTTNITVSFFDSELLEDASHLLDIYNNLPAVVGLTTYRNRMVGWATFTDISIGLISFPGEPEAVDQVDGLIILPLDGTPITAMQEFRDVLYGFKQTKTYALNDNDLTPSEWPITVLDQGLGCSLHGVCTVLDSAGINVDYLVITDFTGLLIFNGAYAPNPLSWKIKDFWLDIDKNSFNKIQLVNDVIEQNIYIALPDGTMLMANYANGLDAEKIRFSPWTFYFFLTSLALINKNTLILAPRQVVT